MNRDKLDNELRRKLGDTRIEPPLDMWHRIAATLHEQELTTDKSTGTTPEINIRRPRKLRFGYAAAAAILVCAIVFGLRFSNYGENQFVGNNLSVEYIEVLTPDQIEQFIAENTDFATQPARESTIHDQIRTTAIRKVNNVELTVAATQEIIMVAQSVTTPETSVVPIEKEARTESAKTEAKTGIEQTSDIERTKDGTSSVAATPKKNSATTTSNTERRRMPVDRPIVITEKRKTNRRAAPSISVYSANFGGLSNEKTLPTGVRSQSSDLTIYESLLSNSLGSIKNQESPVKLNHKMPLSGGVSVSYGLTDRLSIESGATYTYMHSEGKSPSSANGAYGIKRDLHYVGVPVGVSYDILQRHRIDLYANVSALFEMCVESKETKTFKDNGVSGTPDSKRMNVKGIQPSVGLHLGAEIKLTQTLGLYVEPGINYYFENSTQPNSYRTENPFNFSLRAGLRINL